MLPKAYDRIKVSSISGRYLPASECYEAFREWIPDRELIPAGNSKEGQPIYQLRLGRGARRVLMWSQMHGNESTTTKALLDLVHYLGLESKSKLLDAVTLCIIPVLNPDGARAHTRENAAGVDLNRDAKGRTQPESRILDSIYREFDPHYCFNLHDQRSIYNVGGAPIPATLSFLAPSMDARRTVSGNRLEAMQLIASLANRLSSLQDIGIGRYDDTFNPNCVGDRFQQEGRVTILFEAGHFPGDYERETTRYFVYEALRNALERIASGTHTSLSKDKYEEIPENTTDYVDILVRNPQALSEKYREAGELRIQYEEILRGKTLEFQPRLADPALSSGKFGHLELDLKRASDLEYVKERPAIRSLLP